MIVVFDSDGKHVSLDIGLETRLDTLVSMIPGYVPGYEVTFFYRGKCCQNGTRVKDIGYEDGKPILCHVDNLRYRKPVYGHLSSKNVRLLGVDLIHISSDEYEDEESFSESADNSPDFSDYWGFSDLDPLHDEDRFDSPSDDEDFIFDADYLN